MHTTSPISKLTRVDLRDIWPSESSNFTPWLSDQQNIELLGDTLGLYLEAAESEVSVGPFSADIVCKDPEGRTVLIENQLEKTDHKHLGQIFTYAAGKDAVTIIWISPQFTDEHRAAISWLNKITADEFSFFAVEIELWKIGESQPAPQFRVVEKPNHWSRALRKSNGSNSSSQEKEASDLQVLQLRFWDGFKEFLDTSNNAIRCQNPGYRAWMWHSIGRTGVALSSVLTGRNDDATVRAQFVIHEDFDGTRLEKLRPLLPQIQSVTSQEPDFEKNAGQAKRSRITIAKSIPWNTEEGAKEAYQWLSETHDKLLKVIKPVLTSI